MNEEQRKALVAEIVTEINKTVEAKIENLVNPRLEKLEKAQQTMQVSIDRIDTDMGEDRKDIGDFKLKMGQISNQFQEIRDLFAQQTRTIVHKVEEKVNQSIDSAVEVMTETVTPVVQNTLDDFVATKPKITKKSKFSWKFWRWFKRG